ncbi:MAG: 6,7-dimethyl-8-ribityllumazine synthase [Planctomycetaceae bacterium]|nr:6,7-dimethyl-8-ribityllumazine synthase [Planctomycetaceae bacterium]
MPRTFAGSQEPVAGRWAIVVARYNETITGKLLAGAVDTLTTRGVADGDIDVLWVPGAFELPVVAERLAAGRRYRAILCLGAVIRGETTHDQHINRAVSLGLAESARHWGVPVLFGVLTCDSLEQALNRSGGTVGNKGAECASAALEMASLLAQLPS